MSLNALKVRGAQPSGRAYKLFDERGLFLLVNPSGSKLWRFKYRHARREKLLSLGSFPDVSLAQARKLGAEARGQLTAGIDPAAARQAEKFKHEAETHSFEMVANEWLAKFPPTWPESHSSKVTRRLERDIYPRLGKRPANDITPRELLQVLRKIEARGAIETAHSFCLSTAKIAAYFRCWMPSR